MIADAILSTGNFDNVGYVLKTEADEEIFTFYPDEDAAPPADALPQYLDDNVEVFDPTSAVTTKNFKSCSSSGNGWLATAAKSFFGYW